MPDQTIRQDPGQLALELPSALPSLALEPEWKAQARLWGHTLHPMCSYLASFPAALAHAFIARYSRPGDVVLDPFAGRGTAPVQAAAEGRIGVGNDLNPLAHVLTSAKLEPASSAEARTRLAALRLVWAGEAGHWLDLADRVVTRPGHPSAFVPAAGSGDGPDARTEPVPDEVSVAFHPRTLAQLLLVRSHLRLDDRTDRFLAGAMAGHPPRQDAGVPVDGHAQHLQHGAALRPGLRAAHGLPAARARGVRLAGREARPPVPPTAARIRRDQPPGRRADRRSPLARRAARPRAAGSRPPHRDLAALPARAQVRLLQLAPDLAARVRRPGDRRGARRRPPASAVPRVHARRARGPPARRSPTTASRW